MLPVTARNKICPSVVKVATGRRRLISRTPNSSSKQRNSTANSWLKNIQLFRRAREVAMAGDGFKGNEQVPIRKPHVLFLQGILNIILLQSNM